MSGSLKTAESALNWSQLQSLTKPWGPGCPPAPLKSPGVGAWMWVEPGCGWNLAVGGAWLWVEHEC